MIEAVEEELHHGDAVENSASVELIPALPVEKRRSTDRLFLFLIILAWLGMTLIGLVATGRIKSDYIKAGNPSLLVHGIDYKGNICGISEEVADLPKRVFPNFYGSNLDSRGNYVPPLFSICAASCPKEDDLRADPYNKYGSWKIEKNTRDFINNCIYIDSDRDKTSATTIISDFIQVAPLIGVVGFVASVICSMLFLFICRIPLFLRTVVWFCIYLIFVLFASSAYLILEEAKEQTRASYEQNRTEVILLRILGSILTACAVLWLCVICFLRQRIAFAIGLIKESATALVNMPLILFMPLVQTTAFVALTAITIYYLVYLVSSGEVTTHGFDSNSINNLTGNSYKTISYDLNAQRSILYILFVYFWSMTFIEAIGQLSSAHAVIAWYFAEIRAQITSGQVMYSLYLVTRYHSGTAAMGALLIMTFRALRMALNFLQQRIVNVTKKRRFCLCWLRCLCCWLFCCFQLLERYIQYLNKHAFIQSALHGTSFFPSAVNAFTLLLMNMGNVAAVCVLGDFVVLVGKLSITLTCSLSAYLYMTNYMADRLNGFVLPTAFVALLAFSTSTMFLGVLSGTADALLQACIEDELREKNIQQLEEEQRKLKILTSEDDEESKISNNQMHNKKNNLEQNKSQMTGFQELIMREQARQREYDAAVNTEEDDHDDTFGIELNQLHYAEASKDDSNIVIRNAPSRPSLARYFRDSSAENNKQSHDNLLSAAYKNPFYSSATHSNSTSKLETTTVVNPFDPSGRTHRYHTNKPLQKSLNPFDDD